MATVGVNLTALILLSYVAMVIARAQRRTRDAAIRLSTVDSLTGLFNRTFFFAAIEREIARSARSGRGFCLLMMDLDELKSINDRVGHFHGDRVLRGVGDVITLGVRQIDTAARYGGDEFVVLLPETDPTGAFVLAEKIRLGVRSMAIELPPGSPQPSLSIGVGGLPRRRPDRGRADHQRRRRDVRVEARRQGPRHRGPHADHRASGDAGVASLRERHRPRTPTPTGRPRLLDARHPRRIAGRRRSSRPRPASRSTRPPPSPRPTRTSWDGWPPTVAPGMPTAASRTRRRARSEAPTRSWPAGKPVSPLPREWPPSMPRSPRSFGLATGSSPRSRPTARRASSCCGPSVASGSPSTSSTRPTSTRSKRRSPPRRPASSMPRPSPTRRRSWPTTRRSPNWPTGTARCTSSTTRSRRHTSAGRSSSGRTWSPNRPRSSSAATAT